MSAPDEARPSPVTIVIPVYGDLPSLSACVDAVIEHVDLTTHRLLLSNDNGPEADEIEEALLARIGDHPGVRYHRNPANLGFVGNCNTAVLEVDDTDNDILLLNSDTLVTAGFLDELTAVLADSPAHGAVCPRSNNATIASLPFGLRRPARGRSVERTELVHRTLGPLLPRYSPSPVSMGFCLLIRRDLIRRFGLFDEVFAPGYGEENDFCLRIGRHGFRSLIAHRSLVYHLGARSFLGARREALRSAHERILVKRHPGYTAAVRRYIDIERDPVDVFADALVPDEDGTALLVDLGDDAQLLRPDRSGLIAELTRRQGEGLSVTLAVPARRVATARRLFPAVRVISSDRVDGVWDAGLALGRSSSRQRARLNRTCLRLIAASPRKDLPEAAVAADATAVIAAAQAPADIDALRERWDRLTAEPGYARLVLAPRESRTRRTIRAAERAFPAPVGYLKGAARRALRRQPS